MTHFIIHTNTPPPAGKEITGYLPPASQGDTVTIVPESGGVAHGTVIEKDLPGYVSPTCGRGDQDFGKGFVKIRVDK